MEGPLVSITIPAYNAEEFIGRAIRSALSQTHKNIEVVVLDDGSTDKTGDMVRALQKTDSRVRYYYQDNQGLAAARNRLLSLCRGEYVTFLDHDDEILPHKTEIQLEAFRRNPNIAMVYGDIIKKYFDGRQERAFVFKKPRRGRVFYEYLLEGNFIPLISVLIKRDILEKYLPFNLNYKVAEEWDVFLKVAKDYDIDYVDKVVGIYNVHKSNFTIKYPLLGIEEMLLIMDSWERSDPNISLFHKRKFIKSKAEINLQKIWYADSQKQKIKIIIDCVRLNPCWLRPYLKLLQAICFKQSIRKELK
ncbi:MAG: glycosyltransferase [Candidatus Omnitrophica bacterium]|nr:glycosyltransferase [Candidatus Omnitrophota bacterium]